MPETLSSMNISTKLERIAQMPKQHPERVFNSIGHVIGGR